MGGPGGPEGSAPGDDRGGHGLGGDAGELGELSQPHRDVVGVSADLVPAAVVEPGVGVPGSASSASAARATNSVAGHCPTQGPSGPAGSQSPSMVSSVSPLPRLTCTVSTPSRNSRVSPVRAEKSTAMGASWVGAAVGTRPGLAGRGGQRGPGRARSADRRAPASSPSPWRGLGAPVIGAAGRPWPRPPRSATPRGVPARRPSPGQPPDRPRPRPGGSGPAAGIRAPTTAAWRAATSIWAAGSSRSRSTPEATSTTRCPAWAAVSCHRSGTRAPRSPA